jgi:hypothetical protein
MQIDPVPLAQDLRLYRLRNRASENIGAWAGFRW